MIKPAFECQLVAASAPGGMARQYRIQYHPHPQEPWRMYGTFCSREQAERCLQQLLESGYDARLIDVRICPAGL